MVDCNLAYFAPIWGAVASLICLLFGIIAIFHDSIGIAFYTLIISIIVAIIETGSNLGRCFVGCYNTQQVLNEKLFFKNWYFRGGIYAAASIVMFIKDQGYCIGAALFLWSIVILYWAAQCQGKAEEQQTAPPEWEQTHDPGYAPPHPGQDRYVGMEEGGDPAAHQHNPTWMRGAGWSKLDR